MRGKLPKEREKYLLRAEGTLVEVSREVYLEWYRTVRRERYQRERNRKHGTCPFDGFMQTGNAAEGTEETALRNICTEKLYEALGKLPDGDACLVWLLYFKDATVTEAAEYFGCSRKTLRKRRERVLAELSRMLREAGIRGICG